MKQGQKRNNAIQSCMLFEGIEPEKSEQLLKEKAQCRTFQKGECIYTPEHFEKSLGILIKGRAVVEKAYSLLGKVNYFWGGKSLVFGWDDRWGTPMEVTAAGSGSTGTVRPFGLDCSGFVDWTFYNATNGSYYPGRGGGAATQHSYCTNISWSDAQPGDLRTIPMSVSSAVGTQTAIS